MLEIPVLLLRRKILDNLIDLSTTDLRFETSWRLWLRALCGVFVQLVIVIGMLGVQLQINHESLPKEREILSECEARG